VGHRILPGEENAVASRVGGFATDQQRVGYEQVYDRILERDWPVPHEDLDLATSFGATRVRRSEGGGRTPLLMVHPTTGSSLGWYPIIPLLCGDRAVYTPDTIGTCGRSVQDAPVGSVQDLVSWLTEVVDMLGLDRFHLLGYSEGGWIAGSHAALSARRDRLASLTLIEPAGAIERVRTGFLIAMIARAIKAMAARDRTAALARFNRWLNGDLDLTAAQLELLEVSMGAYKQRLPRPGRLSDDELGRIEVPTLLMMAAETKLYDPSRAAERARRTVPDLVVDITPRAGHGLLFQYPDLLTGRINGFLDEHD
jgi:pimeloyl-ACP methyl ester carboxylesterase